MGATSSRAATSTVFMCQSLGKGKGATKERLTTAIGLSAANFRASVRGGCPRMQANKNPQVALGVFLLLAITLKRLSEAVFHRSGVRGHVHAGATHANVVRARAVTRIDAVVVVVQADAEVLGQVVT